MLIFKKEKQVVELALKHAAITGESLQIAVEAVKAFLAGDTERLGESTTRVNDLETEADGLLREIRELLYSGAYLPTIRGDIYRLLSAVDKVTNKTENCLDFVNYQRPGSTGMFREDLDEILDMTEACFAELSKALRAFFKPKGQVEDLRKHCRQVGTLESSIDDRERVLTRRVFESELPLPEKQHIVKLLARIVNISDKIENASDELELASLKSII